MTLDEWICGLPLIGKVMRRMYDYFCKHIFFTDAIHICIGLGIGLLIGKYIILGIVFVTLGLLGHVYAYARS